MHDAVEAAEPLHAFGHAGLGRAGLEQVAGEAPHAVELLERLGAPPGCQDARALIHAQLRDRATDARRGTRDEDAPSFEHR